MQEVSSLLVQDKLDNVAGGRSIKPVHPIFIVYIRSSFASSIKEIAQRNRINA